MKIQLVVLPAIPVASGGTKIVPCLLPRLQHWQHDVAIHSQYCISLAFCEKVAANLSPQSTRLSMWREQQPRYGMKGVGSAPSPHIAFHSSAAPLRHAPPPHSFSPGGACSLSLQIKAIGLPLLPVCDGWKSELFLCRPMCHFSSLQVGCGLRRKEGLNGNQMVVTIKL